MPQPADLVFLTSTFCINKPDWRLPDRQHDAAFVAVDAVIAAGFVDDKCATPINAYAVGLRAFQNKEMLVAGVRVHWHHGAGLIAQQRA